MDIQYFTNRYIEIQKLFKNNVHTVEYIKEHVQLNFQFKLKLEIKNNMQYHEEREYLWNMVYNSGYHGNYRMMEKLYSSIASRRN